MGAYYKSRHIKFFQDVYLKLGVFEISKLHQEKCVTALKRVLNYFPSLVNWNLNTPAHVATMK